MIVRFAPLLLAVSAALAPGAARAADNITCIDTGYDAAEERAFADYRATFSPAEFSENGPPAPLIDILVGRGTACGQQHGWSPDAVMQAITYRVYGLSAEGVEKVSTLAPAQWDAVRKAYAALDKAILLRIIEQTLADAEISEADDDHYYQTFARLGIEFADANSETVGAWLSAKTSQAQARDRFSAL